LLIAGNRRTDEEIEDMLENGFPGTFSNSVKYLFDFFLSLFILKFYDYLDYG
jgi:hypothetical protein